MRRAELASSAGAERVEPVVGRPVREARAPGGHAGVATAPGPRPGPGRRRNDAPRRVRNSMTLAPSSPSSPASRSRGQSPAKSRGTKATSGSPRPSRDARQSHRRRPAARRARPVGSRAPDGQNLVFPELRRRGVIPEAARAPARGRSGPSACARGIQESAGGPRSRRRPRGARRRSRGGGWRPSVAGPRPGSPARPTRAPGVFARDQPDHRPDSTQRSSSSVAGAGAIG